MTPIRPTVVIFEDIPDEASEAEASPAGDASTPGPGFVPAVLLLALAATCEATRPTRVTQDERVLDLDKARSAATDGREVGQ